MNINYIHPADQLVMFMQRIYDKGLTTTSGGNLSIIDDEGNVWITPAGIDKGSLNRNDIVCVKTDGTVVGMHRPSSELPFHKAVYQMRPDIKAVLHAHPPALVSFSIARKVPNLDLMPSVRNLCREVRIATYAVPGSDQLGENIGKCFMEGCNIVLLENHGVCIGAEDMFTAFQQFETLEFTSKLEIVANRIGKLLPMPEDATNIQVLHFMNGEVETIDSDKVEKAGDYLKITTNHFSPFAIAYEFTVGSGDPVVENGAASQPKTGDPAQLALWFTLAGLSLAGMAYTALHRRKRA